MATNTLIMGESGTGKSTSIRTLNPSETFIINVLDKPLPFKGYKNNYTKLTEEGGNYCATDQHSAISQIIGSLDKKEKWQHIKNVVIDDFQYVMANEFMRRARERGYDKFTEIGQNAWNIIGQCSNCRDDLYFFILSHTETDSTGKVKCKTIGKMLDSTITLEGMFTIVLHSLVMDKQYKFLTQNDGTHIAKSPLGMFDSTLLDNDLAFIKQKMTTYFGDSE
jgi:hypothetical protein